MKKILFIIMLLISFNAPASYNVLITGDSWTAGSFNPQIREQINSHLGVYVIASSVDGEKSGDLDKSLDDSFGAGLNLGDGAFMVINIGGIDFITGVSRDQTLANIKSIVDRNIKNKVFTIISGAPDVASTDEVNDQSYPLKLDPIYTQLKSYGGGWVEVVDVMSKLMRITPFQVSPGDSVHLNANGYLVFNLVLANKIMELKGLPPTHFYWSDVVSWYTAAGLNDHDGCIAAKLVEMSYGCNT